jgi:uncharacterized membrane protein
MEAMGRKGTVEQLTQQNVEAVRRLEDSVKLNGTRRHRLASAITRFCGSMTFVWIHTLWYVSWIILNIWLPERARFDPFPFQFLTLVVSLEAIFLSTFILITQNRQGILSERRAHLDLQIDMLAEQENTKMLGLLQRIARKVGVNCEDEEINAMTEATRPDKLARQIEESIDETTGNNTHVNSKWR